MEKIIYFGVPIAIVLILFLIFEIFVLIGRILNKIKNQNSEIEEKLMKKSLKV